MPSLRERMTTYLRQLSFVHEPRGDDSPRGLHLTKLHRSGGHAANIGGGVSPSSNHPSQPSSAAAGSGCFITQYLEGRLPATGGAAVTATTAILHGKEPSDMPELQLLRQPTTVDRPVTAACTGPEDGLTGVRRSRLHLSAGPEIDFIDTALEDEDVRAEVATATVRPSAPPHGGEAGAGRRPSGGRRVLSTVPSKQLAAAAAVAADSNANRTVQTTPKNVTINIVVNTIRPELQAATAAASNNNTATVKPSAAESAAVQTPPPSIDTSAATVPVFAAVPNWRLENDHAYGLSVSLYEQNYGSSERAGDPIADCFGLVVRGQSAVMAMADGVNWGECLGCRRRLMADGAPGGLNIPNRVCVGIFDFAHFQRVIRIECATIWQTLSQFRVANGSLQRISR